MTSPRFVPRSLCRPITGFGQDPSIHWRNPSALSQEERDQLGAAQMQHRIALAMRAAIAAGPGSVGLYAVEAAGPGDAAKSAARLGRMLRGEVIMRFEDLASADRHLGESIRESGWPGFPLGLGG